MEELKVEDKIEILSTILINLGDDGEFNFNEYDIHTVEDIRYVLKE